MPTIISGNLKRLQKLKELTISQLAEKSGVSVRTIERIRTGKHVPDIDTIKKLAKALGQKPERLVKGAIKKQEISAEIALSHNAKSLDQVFKKAQRKLRALDKKLDKAHAKDVERAELNALPVGAIKDREDFTRFEREMAARASSVTACNITRVNGKPVSTVTDNKTGETFSFTTPEEAWDFAMRRKQGYMNERARKQTIWAVCLTAAFLFGLYVLL